MGKKSTVSNEITVAKITSKQLISTTLITAISTVLVTLISTGFFSPEKDKENNNVSKTSFEQKNQSKLKFPFFRTKNNDTINLNDLTNSGVKINSIKSEMDWHAIVDVSKIDTKILDSVRISPGIQYDVIKFSKTDESSKYLVKRFASQRALMDFWVETNQDYEIAYFKKEELSNKQTVGSLRNHWYLIFNIEDYQLNLKNQEIRYIATRWNAFQLKNNNYYGRLIVGDEEKSTIGIGLPKNKIIKSVGFTIQKLGRENPELPFPSKDVDTTLKKKYLLWRIHNPKDSHIYRTYVNWEKPPITISPQPRLLEKPYPRFKQKMDIITSFKKKHYIYTTLIF